MRPICKISCCPWRQVDVDVDVDVGVKKSGVVCVWQSHNVHTWRRKVARPIPTGARLNMVNAMSYNGWW